MGTVGARIYNPMDLFGKKSVYVKRWNRPCATAFLVSTQLSTLRGFMEYGIFEYTPAEKKNKPTFTQIVRSYKGDDGLYKLGEKL